MPSNWIDNSEIVAGLILQERIKSIPSPEIFHPEFQEVIKDIKDGATKEELIKRHKIGKINAAHNRANDLNGLGDNVDWLDILEHSSEQWSRAEYFEQSANQLKQGNDPDYAPLRKILDDSTGKTEIVTASDVIPSHVPLILSGYKPIDYYLGGYPEAGLLTILGHTGNGKTSLILSLNDHFLKQYPKKHSLFVTTEMFDSELLMRAHEVGAVNCLDRFHIVEEFTRNVNSVWNKAENVKDLGIIFVDILDDLITGEVSEPKMSNVYQTLAPLARKFRVPVVATAQPHGGAGKTLRPDNARWSRMAEARSYQFWTIYNPKNSYAKAQESDVRLEKLSGAAWILIWKCRGGARPTMDNPKLVETCKDRFPFAIPVPFHNEKGWGDSVKPSYAPISLNQDQF